MKTIDGSILEGGGQILRISLSLASLLTIPIKITKIRAGRRKPGLAAQHLKGVELCKQICNAKVTGAQIGSTEIEFIPFKIKGGNFNCEIQTAGSIALLVQVSLPVCLFADSPIDLNLKGGTNCELAPQIDFTTEIFRPNLEKFGATFDFELIKRGYFPKGGGSCKISITPVKELIPIDLTSFGEITKIFGWSFTAGVLPIKLANEMSDGAKYILTKYISNREINIEDYKESSDIATGNCSGIILGCETSTNCIIGTGKLGNKKISSLETGKKAGQQIANVITSKACCDEYIQDQLIIFMALANGISQLRVGEITLHTKTAIYIVETLTNAKFTIKNEGETNIIVCQGIGFQNNFL